MHTSADKTVWDRKNNQVTLIGHAVVSQPGETITADRVELRQADHLLDAWGNCVYNAIDTVIYADEMHFNLQTRTGVIIGGRVTNDRFALTGKRIIKLSDNRFQTISGSYTTCLDCPQSWMITADDIDMEFDGYAYMKNVTTKVKDAPFFWLPYLVIPVKKSRQSGLLFPRIGFFNGGFTYSIPFFWAINDNSDATVAVGEYGGRGERAEIEGRYLLSGRSGGTGHFFFLNDATFLREIGQGPDSIYANSRRRWALDIQQIQELPGGIDQKLKILEASDNRYPVFIGDIPGRGESVLASDLIFSKHTDNYSAYIAGRRFRNLLYFDNTNADTKARSAIDFDPSTVQLFPTGVLTTKDQFLFGSSVAAGLTFQVSNFSRAAGPYDLLPPPNDPSLPPDHLVPQEGKDPLRKATRLAFTPTVYTTLRPFDRMSLVPSAEYRGYFYSFHNVVPNLTRGYLLLRADLSTQLEKIYDLDDPNTPKMKHLIRPILSYSLIPFVNEDQSHPFIRQMDYARTKSYTGLNFDDLDIVPRDSTLTTTNYFIPLGNSLTYGATTQLIRRRGKIDALNPTYDHPLEFRAGQTFDFRALNKDNGGSGHPFSRLFASLLTSANQLSTSTDYYYYPYLAPDRSRNVVTTSATYVLRKGVTRRVYEFDRSISLGYAYNFSTQNPTSNLRASAAYSISDYFLPSGYFSYDFVTKKMFETGLALRFQSPSQCWRLDLGVRQFPCQGVTPSGTCINPTIDLLLNLAGSGYSTGNQLPATQ